MTLPSLSLPRWQLPTRRQIGAFFFALCIAISSFAAALSIAGCAAVVAALPTVIAVIVDGMQVLDAISSFTDRWFVKHPDADAAAKVQLAIDKARAALNLALRAAQGTDDAANAQTDAAFEDFKQAYLALLELVRPYGVTQASDTLTAQARLSAGGDHLDVPPPLALARKPASR